MSGTTPNKSMLQNHEQSVLTAIDKYFSGVSTLTLVGVSYTPAALKTVLTNDLATQTATTALLGQYTVAVQAANQSKAKAQALLKLLRSFLVSQYGSNLAAVLKDFGYSTASTRPPKKTVKEKVLAVDKSLATRAARHTLGKKQKKEVTGTTTTASVAVPAAAASASK
jgi:hypothetical protein